MGELWRQAAVRRRYRPITRTSHIIPVRNTALKEVEEHVVTRAGRGRVPGSLLKFPLCPSALSASDFVGPMAQLSVLFTWRPGQPTHHSFTLRSNFIAQEGYSFTLIEFEKGQSPLATSPSISSPGVRAARPNDFGRDYKPSPQQARVS